MYFKQITTPGLGCYSYAIGCPAAGVMAVFDPRRDIGVYLNIAEENGMKITHIFDTHVHADHVSGAQELRAATGADIYIHESAPVKYEAEKLRDGDGFKFGNAFIRTLHTPGHTPDSVSFLVHDLARSAEPEMILTGDLLFVGDIGRPDLPGEEILEEQVRNLYDSLYETLKPLPDHLEVFPGHGQGSLCGQGMSGKESSTLGYERLSNPMLKYADFTDFREAVLSRHTMRPQSFSNIIATNINGAVLISKCESKEHLLSAKYELSAGQTEEAGKNGAVLLDLRDAFSYGAAHIPGSINVDFSDGAKLNWVGAAVPAGKPIVLILSKDSRFGEICSELYRIGYDTIKGFLKGGIRAWVNSGRETGSIKYFSAPELRMRLTVANPPGIIDVRNPEEFNTGKIENAVNYTFDSIVSRSPYPIPPDKESVIVCQSGFRAGIAASMLKAREYSNISVLSGGMGAWLAYKE